MSTLDEISSHLELLGYEVHRSEPGLATAVHKERVSIYLRDSLFWISLFSFTPLNPQWKRKEAEVLESVNEFNTRAGVCRCLINNEGELIVLATLPTLYEEASFARFLEQYHGDVSLIGQESLGIIQYIGSS